MRQRSSGNLWMSSSSHNCNLKLYQDVVLKSGLQKLLRISINAYSDSEWFISTQFCSKFLKHYLSRYNQRPLNLFAPNVLHQLWNFFWSQNTEIINFSLRRKDLDAFMFFEMIRTSCSGIMFLKVVHKFTTNTFSNCLEYAHMMCVFLGNEMIRSLVYWNIII